MKHLAIFKGEAGELILQGQKTVEARFSKAKIVPFEAISPGDLVYIKPAGKDVIGQFKVKKVFFFDGLEKEDVRDLKKRYGDKILADKDFWQNKESASYGTIIFIGESSRFITSPLKLPKKDLRGWVII